MIYYYHTLILYERTVSMTLYISKTMHVLMSVAKFSISLKMQRKGRFIIIDRLSNLSSLNPIEKLWVTLKRELHRRYPDTATFKGSPKAIKAMLHKRLMDV